MSKIQRLLFSVSLTAVWCLLMPPYLYGVLGILITFLGAFFVGAQLPGWTVQVKGNIKIWYIAVIGMIYYIFCAEFVDRWTLSSKMSAVAGLFHLDTNVFLWIVAIVGCAAGLYALLYLMCGIIKTKVTNQEELSTTTESRHFTKNDYIFCIVIALLFGARLALSPWSSVLTGNDSAAYLYVGMMLRKGVTLYTEIFEHKGMFLYLIDAAGMSLTNGSLTGVWILEIINMLATAVLMLKTAKLFSNRKGVQYITVAGLIASTFVCLLLTDGNLSEEWVLPWITLALYICLKYFIDSSYRFYEIILLGISFTFIVFIRANMIAVFAAFMPIIFIQMIIKKDWKNLGICIANFLLGCAIIFVPIVIYTCSVGSFGAMIENYFLFSFSYMDESSMPVYLVMWRLFRRLTIYSVLLVASIKLFYKNHLFQMNLWFYVISIVVASISGRAHAHYAIILIPAMILPITMLLNKCPRILADKVEIKIIAILSIMTIVQIGSSIITYAKPALSEVAEYLIETTDPEDNVVMMGNNCIYYLESNRYTTNKFFYHAPAANVSDRIYHEIIEELAEVKPDVMVATGSKEELLEEDTNLAKICELLDSWCEEGVYSCETYDTFYVYRLNER